ncbi:MAG: 4-hydroxythreonine-4-phosphate dehydrogenase PdxA, partial [Candidatus Omnitrophica bacterium]|nr:4-hydroxythreonine-4-phosphate dehydrogenase PdxA [Candidatus Omnitrophota bacterium]
MHKVKGLAEFVIIGDKRVFERVSSAGAQASGVKFLDLRNVPRDHFRFGKVSPDYGKASIEYLDLALGLLKEKKFDCLVTCPVSKESINLAGYKFTGHTEYLASRTRSKDILMLLLNNTLRISLLTRHIPLRQVGPKLNKGDISQTILMTYRCLKEYFDILHPRIVVCGMNPHASDNGVLGDEENMVLRPAIRALNKKISFLEGPLPADSAIAKASHKKYDAVVASYHDQAL